MALPPNLSSYEFARELLPLPSINHFYHLKVEYTDGLPKTLESPRTYEGALKTLGLPASALPAEIEIGCGKGNFLVEYCSQKPEKAFVAIDQDMGIAAYAARRAAKRPALQNVRVLCGDAFYFLRDFIPDNTFDVFHMYFPDPWPKKRHHKRRLLKQDYLREVVRTAVPGARFHWATDYKKYHLSALESFSACPGIEIAQNPAEPVLGITTNFERKYIAEGRPIYRTTFVINK